MMKVLLEIIEAIPLGGWISLLGIIGYFTFVIILRKHYRKNYDKKFKPLLMSITNWEIKIIDNPKDKKLKILKWGANFSLFLILLGGTLIIFT